MKFINFFNFVLKLRKLKDKANDIIESDENRERNGFFAWTSILYSLFAAACALGGGYLFTAVSDNIVLSILFIGFAVVLLVGAFILLFWAIVRLVLQFKINKSYKSWLALIVLIAAIIGAVVLELYFLSVF